MEQTDEQSNGQTGDDVCQGLKNPAAQPRIWNKASDLGPVAHNCCSGLKVFSIHRWGFFHSVTLGFPPHNRQSANVLWKGCAGGLPCL